jgi:hypothetical protein
MLKQVRIGRDGKIVDADRVVHTTRKGDDGADRVQWLAPGGGSANYQIRFGYLDGSPFQDSSGKPHIIDVPHSPLPVTQGPKRYKYDVLSNGVVVDDPDVIIDS